MNFKNMAICCSLITSFLFSCGTADDGSSLKRNAIPNDENVSVVRIASENAVNYALVLKNKGYKLSCDNPIKLRNLIASTGFPVEFISSTTVYPEGSPEAESLKIKEQPEINCLPGGKILFKSSLDDKTKFFFTDAKIGTTRLYMLGCRGLLDAMGFDISKAEEIESKYIDSLKIFTVDDAHDISCISGVEVDSKLKWLKGGDVALTVSPGESIGFFSYEASRPDRSKATLTYSSEGKCDWIKFVEFSEALLVTGTTPNDYRNQTCKVTIEADKGQLYSDKKTLMFSTEAVKPKLESDCRDAELLSMSDFTVCKVKSDLGLISMTVLGGQCDQVFDYSSNSLNVAKLPLAGQSCSAEFVAELNGVESDSFEVTVSTICDSGYQPGKRGTCEKVKCDDVHEFGDVWYLGSDSLSGTVKFSCEANKAIKNHGVSSCFEGFGLRSGICLKSCRSDFLEGDIITLPVSNGVKKEFCENRITSEVLICNPGNLDRSGVCKLACDATHAEGDTWSSSIDYGSWGYKCESGTILANLGCDTGYLKRGDNCKIACDSSHVDQESWDIDTTNGIYTYSCSGSVLNSSLNCNDKHRNINGTCTRVFNDCGIHRHLESWSKNKCLGINSYREDFQCEDGQEKFLRSVKLTTRCEVNRPDLLR